MSELTYLEKLLDGVKVEWQTLGKVLKRTKGTKITAGQMKALHKDNAPLKIFAGGKTVAFVDFKDIPEKDINREPSIIVKSRGIIEFEYYDKPFSHKNEMWSYHSNNDAISIKYIYYFLKINEGYFQKIGGKMQMPQIATPDTDKFEVPIPCPDNPEKSLAIQSEIVRILDTFTALTAELTAELNMRKKQYNYYRDQLLSFDTEDVPHLPMGQKDIGEFIRGGTFQKKDFMDAGVGCIHYGQIYTYYGTYTKKTKTYISAALAKKCKKAQKGNLIIATTSENDEDVCKAVAWLGSEDIAVSSDACIYKHNLNPKYVSYYFQTEQFQNQKRQYITGAKVRRVNADNLSKILIPVPSMEVQERIVSILDKFDTLTYSITEGLPREIELRQKQYEYYRDLLFSFPKPETVSN
ncbi:restriction endonuclease subunit S [Escherichia albertii]|uniref:restriction endonuclease subunit S n=1 Tax=Escherichia albertii TaxID=208962 RepID=UPI00211A91C6|nr:restriction endonuclease subunit S [Escherichia albertii]MCQ8923023.1 restriction endonuclease subunit S [Escherichia albertii]MCQ8940796.1 restriction endonuclease subunit S [Escherichia albertii]MCQ8953958.1 restriction endonuclease subunit S [Escherichia albertii]MCQ8981179.1 restriction endonuclease subunit S [Escherichia albertii]MCQ8994566.1 restriction endonuclease subunit S [Escherichia albertii]